MSLGPIRKIFGQSCTEAVGENQRCGRDFVVRYRGDLPSEASHEETAAAGSWSMLITVLLLCRQSSWPCIYLGFPSSLHVTAYSAGPRRSASQAAGVEWWWCSSSQTDRIQKETLVSFKEAETTSIPNNFISTGRVIGKPRTDGLA